MRRFWEPLCPSAGLLQGSRPKRLLRPLPRGLLERAHVQVRAEHMHCVTVRYSLQWFCRPAATSASSRVGWPWLPAVPQHGHLLACWGNATQLQGTACEPTATRCTADGTATFLRCQATLFFGPHDHIPVQAPLGPHGWQDASIPSPITNAHTPLQVRRSQHL